MHFDDVFGLVGEMGVFQGGIFIVSLFAAAWGVESIYMVFVGKSQNTSSVVLPKKLYRQDTTVLF